MPYNNTDLYSDVAHMSRFQLDCVLAGISVIHALVVAVLVLWRRNYLPLKPHGHFYLLFKILFFILIQTEIITTVPLDRLGNAIVSLIAPFLAFFPVIVRYVSFHYNIVTLNFF